MFVQYLQMQDRVSEAIAMFDQVKDEEEGKRENDASESQMMKIQKDYMAAYFDLFRGQAEGFKVARRIVQKYEEYPILAWRMPFLDMLDQLNEYDGEVIIEDEEKE